MCTIQCRVYIENIHFFNWHIGTLEEHINKNNWDLGCCFFSMTKIMFGKSNRGYNSSIWIEIFSVQAILSNFDFSWKTSITMNNWFFWNIVIFLNLSRRRCKTLHRELVRLESWAQKICSCYLDLYSDWISYNHTDG